MQEYDYKHLPNLIFGSMLNEEALEDRINRGALCENALVIVMGFGRLTKRREGMKTFKDSLGKLNDSFKKINTTVLYVRGVSDDAEMFKNNAIDMSNIKTLQDYTVVNTNYGECLCIGGRTSYDRSWRKKQALELGRDLWHEGEEFFLDEGKLETVLREGHISMLFTDVPPNCVKLKDDDDAILGWLSIDKTLSSDTENERLLADRIHSHLMSNKKNKPKKWFVASTKSNLIKNATKTVNGITYEPIPYGECRMHYDVTPTDYRLITSDFLTAGIFV